MKNLRKPPSLRSTNRRIDSALHELWDVQLRLHVLAGAITSHHFDDADGYVFASGIEETVRRILATLEAELGAPLPRRTARRTP